VKRKREGATNQVIADEVKLSIRQIQNINAASRIKTSRKIKKSPGPGKSLSKSDKLSIRNQLRKNPYKSLADIAAGQPGKPSARTLSRYLNSIRWARKKATKKSD